MKLAEIYERRGWNSNGIPSIETVKRLKIDFPEIIDLINKYSLNVLETEKEK